VSRNARFYHRKLSSLGWLSSLIFRCCALLGQFALAASFFPFDNTSRARVIFVHDPAATEAFQARPDRVREMFRIGLTNLTRKASVPAAWGSLLSTQDIVGIKVFCAPGSDVGTRPAVVAALVESLLEARVPATNIVIWDRQKADLRRAGFVELGLRYGVRVEGSANAGYDEKVFYLPERPILGQLIWGDLEFGQKGENVGRRSFVSKLVSQGMTKIITITPLLNHNTLGVCGHLYSLAMGSVDNAIRFENDLYRLTGAVPEIYALPSLSDRVVLCVTDALVAQYEGERNTLLHYSSALNELRFSRDPVALDVLSLRELAEQRPSPVATFRQNSLTNQMELFSNAALLELGVSELDNIRIERYGN
jgi:hypothetical protein